MVARAAAYVELRRIREMPVVAVRREVERDDPFARRDRHPANLYILRRDAQDDEVHDRQIAQQFLYGVRDQGRFRLKLRQRSEEHTSELQSLMRISYAVYCLKKKK